MATSSTSAVKRVQAPPSLLTAPNQATPLPPTIDEDTALHLEEGGGRGPQQQQQQQQDPLLAASQPPPSFGTYRDPDEERCSRHNVLLSIKTGFFYKSWTPIETTYASNGVCLLCQREMQQQEKAQPGSGGAMATKTTTSSSSASSSSALQYTLSVLQSSPPRWWGKERHIERMVEQFGNLQELVKSHRCRTVVVGEIPALLQAVSARDYLRDDLLLQIEACRVWIGVALETRGAPLVPIVRHVVQRWKAQQADDEQHHVVTGADDPKFPPPDDDINTDSLVGGASASSSKNSKNPSKTEVEQKHARRVQLLWNEYAAWTLANAAAPAPVTPTTRANAAAPPANDPPCVVVDTIVSQEKALPLLLRQMEEHKRHPQVQLHLCTILLHIVRARPVEHGQTLLQEGGVPIVLQTLRKTLQDYPTTNSQFQELWQRAQQEREQFEEDDQGMADLPDDASIPAVRPVEDLENPASHSIVAPRTTLNLAQLGRRRLQQVQLMVQLAHLLSWLADTASHAEVLLHHQTPLALQQALQTIPQHLPLQQYVCGCWGGLSHNNPTAQAALVEDGALESILQVLQSAVDAPKQATDANARRQRRLRLVVEMAVGTLWNILDWPAARTTLQQHTKSIPPAVPLLMQIIQIYGVADTRDPSIAEYSLAIVAALVGDARSPNVTSGTTPPSNPSRTLLLQNNGRQLITVRTCLQAFATYAPIQHYGWHVLASAARTQPAVVPNLQSLIRNSAQHPVARTVWKALYENNRGAIAGQLQAVQPEGRVLLQWLETAKK